MFHFKERFGDAQILNIFENSEGNESRDSCRRQRSYRTVNWTGTAALPCPLGGHWKKGIVSFGKLGMSGYYLINRNFIGVGVFERLDDGGFVFGEIFKLHDATFALDNFYDSLGYSAFVESILAMSREGTESLS